MSTHSRSRMQEILSALTLEEKAKLCTGKDFWSLPAIERLNLPSIMLTDGPHGLRKQATKGDHIGLNTSVKATCFPTASALAASWNIDLLTEMGKALGKECRAAQVSVLLGPGINIKRHPLGGRNFEYFSEDPLLAGELAAAWINGVQSQQIGTSLKHYAVNNHEHCRMTVDAIVDQRTLREIYLPAFERAVTQAQPWTIMCAYNKLNGTYLAEHNQLLNDILYDEWQFKGLVVTDWGANNDRVAGLKAGQALEMPSSGDLHIAKIKDAVHSGKLSMATLDQSVARVLELILKAKDTLAQEAIAADLDAHHRLASTIAAESCVLLKNDEQFLPIAPGKRIAVIGALAEHTRYQGTGSSKINPSQLEVPLDEIRHEFGAENVKYAPGYPLSDQPNEEALLKALTLAEQSDIVFLFLGLTPKYESEGFDRQHLRLPETQLKLAAMLGNQLSKTVIILQNGAPVVLPFIDKAPAILEAYLGGQAGASAIAKLLSGKVNPSGKLAETFPLNLDDVPSHRYFPGSKRQVQYRESIWVGYRYFETTKTPVLFPFGHGLSYTTFRYSNLSVQAPAMLAEADNVQLKVTISNTGARAGADIIQCYVGQQNPSVPRPNKELKAFQKVFLQPGEHKDISLTLDYRAFAFWCINRNTWIAESDTYTIHIGASSSDIRCKTDLPLSTPHPLRKASPALKPYFTPAPDNFTDEAFSSLLGYDIPAETPAFPLTVNSTASEIAETALGKPIYQSLLNTFITMMSGQSDSTGEAELLMAKAMVDDMPLRNLPIFNAQAFSEDDITQLLAALNKEQSMINE